MRSFAILAIMLVVGAIAGSKFLASRTNVEAEATLAPRPAQAAALQSNRTDGSNAGGSPSRRRIEIDASADGHFYLEARVGGRDIAFMVDTGASVIALREADARRAGIRVQRSDFTSPMATANGTSYAAPVTLRSVRVAGIEIRDVRAVVVRDEQLSTNLLGASFLNQLRAFQVSDNTLTLEN